MAKLTDKMIRERFTREHEIADPSNRKKFEAVRRHVEAGAKIVRDLLPDDASSQEPLFRTLEQVVQQAVAVFERRSGKPAPAAKKGKRPAETPKSDPTTDPKANFHNLVQAAADAAVPSVVHTPPGEFTFIPAPALTASTASGK